MNSASVNMLNIDLYNIRLLKVKQPKARKGKLKTINKREISIPISLLIRMAIPVTPPSKNPFGSKKAYNPMLASVMPINI